jgi:hypothetical protein
MTTSIRFEEVYARVTRFVGERYGVRVTVRDVAAPAKADLDGAEIVIGRGNDAETRLFLVAHLFGHTVQWNTSDEDRRLGMTRPVNPDAACLDRLEAYEREACAYSQQLLHEAGIRDLDGWLADTSACDFAFLRHFYLTGERRPFAHFWRAGSPKLEPIPIPPFTPRDWRRSATPIVV